MRGWRRARERERVRFLDSPVIGQSDEDMVLDSDLRAMALMDLGIAETWSGLPDSERHLREGAPLARTIGRPARGRLPAAGLRVEDPVCRH